MSRVSWHPEPQSDLKTVLETEIKEWHFHIYFHQNNNEEHQAALNLRDAVLRLRRDGAFVAVPLSRVNTGPIGPHPVGQYNTAAIGGETIPSLYFTLYLFIGSYEIWCPSETFSAVFSYMCLNRGNLSVLIHPLTREQRTDHEHRVAWLGQSYALDLSTLPVYSDDLPSQYSALRLGYSAPATLSIEDRLKIGTNIETILSADKDAAKAPPRESTPSQ